MSGFRFATLATLLLVAGSAAPAQPASQVIDLASYSYAPNALHLAANRQVTLTFVNRAGKAHDFTARSFFAASRIVAGSAPGGRIELAPGERRSITLIPRAGAYKVYCSHFLHAQLGMRAVIDVG